LYGLYGDKTQGTKTFYRTRKTVSTVRVYIKFLEKIRIFGFPIRIQGRALDSNRILKLAKCGAHRSFFNAQSCMRKREREGRFD
jgi:hypothetical protein